MNLAVLYILPLSRIAGEPLAAGLAAQQIFGRYGDTIIRTLMIVSMISGINAYHLMATRVIFTMSRDGLVSDRIVRVNAGAPRRSRCSSARWSRWRHHERDVRAGDLVLAVFFVFNYALSFISVFVLRRREPTRRGRSGCGCGRGLPCCHWWARSPSSSAWSWPIPGRARSR